MGKSLRLFIILLTMAVVVAIGCFVVLNDFDPYDEESLLGRTHQDIFSQHKEAAHTSKPSKLDGNYKCAIDATSKWWDFEAHYVIITFDENDIAIAVSEAEGLPPV